VKNVGNSSRGRSQGVPKMFRAPMYRAHCAVIFAIAQLSCYAVVNCGFSHFIVKRRCLLLMPALLTSALVTRCCRTSWWILCSGSSLLETTLINCQSRAMNYDQLLSTPRCSILCCQQCPPPTTCTRYRCNSSCRLCRFLCRGYLLLSVNNNTTRPTCRWGNVSIVMHAAN